MANKADDFYGVFSLTRAAVFLAALAVVFWVVPLLPTNEPTLSGRAFAQLFSGLTDFGEDAWRGRMPAFIVAAFTSIFLLLLRRP